MDIILCTYHYCRGFYLEFYLNYLLGAGLILFIFILYN